jgi:beta-galactosidase
MGIGARTYGLVWPDRTIQPELWQVKKTPQPVRFEPVDLMAGKVRITNLFNFTNLDEFNLTWQLLEDGEVHQKGSLKVDLLPGKDKLIEISLREPEPIRAAEYRLRLSCSLAKAQEWAAKGHEVAWDEFTIPYPVPPGPVLNPQDLEPLSLEYDDGQYSIVGADFSYTFDERLGQLISLKLGDKELLQKGPGFNCWRAPTANELDEWRNPPIVNQWMETGLDRLNHRVTKFAVDKLNQGTVRVLVETIAAASGTTVSFENQYLYHLLGSGDLILRHRIVALGEFPEWQPGIKMWLPKVGLQMVMPKDFNRFSWYGRGPFETYPDRKSGAKFGVYSGTVQDQYVPYLIPQDCGNKTDVRWATLMNDHEEGVMITAFPSTNVSVSHYSTDNLTRANQRFQLAPGDGITVNIDHAVTGVGGTPVPTLPKYRVMPGVYEYLICLRAFSKEAGSPMELSKRRLPYLNTRFEE